MAAANDWISGQRHIDWPYMQDIIDLHHTNTATRLMAWTSSFLSAVNSFAKLTVPDSVFGENVRARKCLTAELILSTLFDQILFVNTAAAAVALWLCDTHGGKPDKPGKVCEQWCNFWWLLIKLPVFLLCRIGQTAAKGAVLRNEEKEKEKQVWAVEGGNSSSSNCSSILRLS